MPVAVNWGSKVINVPKDYLTFVSGTTYQLDCDDFRLILKDLEDDLTGGMAYLDTHRHVAPITLSGSTYARFVEIINSYTITFEDGFYQVNLTGANNNIVDVLNRNSVSVVANNSSGLIASNQLEYSSYQNRITIDPVNGVSGTNFPIGTVATPVNNIVDALVIAQETGIDTFFFKSSYTVPTGVDVSGYHLDGESTGKVTLTFESNSNTTGIELSNVSVQGYLDGISEIDNCVLLDITGDEAGTGQMVVKDSMIEGILTMHSGMSGELTFLNCKSGVAGQATPTLDMNGADTSLVIRDYTGGIKLTNMIAGNVSSIDILSGQIKLDASNTNATVTVRGLAKITDDASANANFTLYDETQITQVDIDNIASAVWDKIVLDHLDSGTFGEKVGRKLLTTGKFVALK